MKLLFGDWNMPIPTPSKQERADQGQVRLVRGRGPSQREETRRDDQQSGRRKPARPVPVGEATADRRRHGHRQGNGGEEHARAPGAHAPHELQVERHQEDHRLLAREAAEEGRRARGEAPDSKEAEAHRWEGVAQLHDRRRRPRATALATNVDTIGRRAPAQRRSLVQGKQEREQEARPQDRPRPVEGLAPARRRRYAGSSCRIAIASGMPSSPTGMAM